jgi:hypothetical protein
VNFLPALTGNTEDQSMPQATEENTKETSEIDDFDAAQEHLSKAMGIISAVHARQLAMSFFPNAR